MLYTSIDILINSKLLVTAARKHVTDEIYAQSSALLNVFLAQTKRWFQNELAAVATVAAALAHCHQNFYLCQSQFAQKIMAAPPVPVPTLDHEL